MIHNVPQEQPPVDDPYLSEWLTRLVIQLNGALSAIAFQKVHVKNCLTTFTLASQGSTITDDKVAIQFGASGSSADDVSIDSAGLVTFNKSGSYDVRIRLNASCSTSASRLVISNEINGTANVIASIGLVHSGVPVPFETVITHTAEAGDTMQLFQTRDSSGANDGGLQSFPTVNPSIPDVPSAWIQITKRELEA